MICDKCTHLEEFGTKGVDEFFNKCALLDIWNLEKSEECEYFEPVQEEPSLDALLDEYARDTKPEGYIII